DKPEDLSLRVLVPAFMISELKRAFEIGFLLFLPFLIIDLVVASVLMSMGMMMLPPVVVSLPFKLIFFVLVDGWSLVAGSLVQGYGGGGHPRCRAAGLDRRLHYDAPNPSGTRAMQFDRSAEDLGNAIHLEHVNVTVPDQRLATLFYVTGLGLTRDPYLMVSDSNMWVNAGRSQFHLPSGHAQVLRGHTGIVISGRAALLDRLASVARKLDGTAFAYREHNDYVEATCPWGNRVRCYEPDA